MRADVALHPFLSVATDCAPAAVVEDLFVDDLPGRYLVAEPPASLRCRPPLWVDHAEDERRFFFGGRSEGAFDPVYPFAAAGVAVLPHARLVGRGYVVVAGDGRVVAESVSGDHVLATDGHFEKQTVSVEVDGRRHAVPVAVRGHPSRPRLLPGRHILPTHHWHFNYHHWLVECLPRLRHALEWPSLAGCPVIVPPAMAPFQRESLALVGIGSERQVPFDEGDWRVASLVFPTIGQFAPAELAWVRAGLLRAVAGQGAGAGSRPGLRSAGPPEAVHGPRRLYISRGDAATRRLVNEAEVVAALAPLGFARLELTGMPLAEQVARFANAEIVVGPHGSGLTNMLFAPRSAALVELMPRDHVNHCFWLMASVLGQRYAFVSGPVGTPARDFEVPAERVVRAVAAVGG